MKNDIDLCEERTGGLITTMPIIIALMLTLGLCTAAAQAASPGNWTTYETLQDTAANAIDFTWKKECSPGAGAECRLVWKFRNRYRQSVRLTWRVIYETSQGKKVLQKETTVSQGESPEYSAEGEALGTVQVGVSRADVAGVGVVSRADAQAGRSGPVTVTPDNQDAPVPAGRASRAEAVRKFDERNRRISDQFTQTKTAFKEQRELLRSLLEQLQRNHGTAP